MENNIWMPIVDLVVAAQKALNGATECGASVGLHHNNAENIKADLHAVLNARNDYALGEIALGEDYEVYAAKMESCRAWARLSRDTLKRAYGTRWNHQWRSAGFKGSIIIPKTVSPLIEVLNGIHVALKNSPQMEVPDLEITATKGEELHDELSALRNGITNRKVANAKLLDARDAAVLTLRHRLRGLINELKQLIGLNDNRWRQFGFNSPGAQPVPEAPAAVEVEPSGENALSVRWEDTAHTSHFRLWKRVIGQDEDFVFVGRFHGGRKTGCKTLMQNLPSGVEIEVGVSAANRRGQSGRTVARKVVLTKRLEVEGDKPVFDVGI